MNSPKSTPIDYEAIVAGLDEDIRELTTSVRELEARISALETRNGQ